MEREKQTAVVLNHLKYRGGLTAIEAVKIYGIMRLAARIADLRDSGINIRTERVSITNDKGKEVMHFARYHLV
jgi:hypothetical protein